MKIVHVCLSNFFIDDYGYQENYLVHEHIIMGHDVTVIASVENYNSNGVLFFDEPKITKLENGAKLIRLPYLFSKLNKVFSKLRIFSGVIDSLESEGPDVIVFHGLCGYELYTVSKYAHDRNILFHVDSHEDFNNSARSFISKNILHEIYYKSIIKISERYLDKIMCISLEVMDFVEVMYGIDRSKLEFFPLGGIVKSNCEIKKNSVVADEKYDLENYTVFLQSGKFTKRKKVKDTLDAFSKVNDDRLKLLLCGVFDDETWSECQYLIENDKRINFIGWVSPSELEVLLSRADVYIQPGTQSATMQLSLCSGCAVILDNVKSHSPFVSQNGWLVNNNDELLTSIKSVSNQSSALSLKKALSLEIANKLLNYKSLAERLLKR